MRASFPAGGCLLGALLTVVSFVSLGGTSLAAPAAQAEVPAALLTPHRLRCEYLANPLGIDEVAPRLSWALSSTARGQSQAKYQVLVASTTELLAQDQGDVWDSGQVASAATTHIEYAGQPLVSSQKVWWKVRSWNQDGMAGPWSEPATWEMALLKADDWHASWIGYNDNTEHDQPLPLFRKAFKLDGKVRSARAYITGLGYYELEVNGHRVGDAKLAPGYTRFDKRVLYNTLDVTEAVKRGDNALGVMLGNGWYNVATRAPWIFDRAPWRGAPRFVCQLQIEYTDGRHQVIVSDETWKATAGPITYSSIYGGESYDATRELPGWSTASFDDSSWQGAQLLPAPAGMLVAAAFPPIRVTQQFDPVSVNRLSDSTRIYDFGQNMAGCAELSVSGPAGSEVTLVYSELLGDDGQLSRNNIDCHVKSHGADQRFQTDTYRLKGQGTEQWSSRFTYHGFQYVQVSGDPEVLDQLKIKACAMHTDFDKVGTFECSNDLLNKIWTAASWAYLSNFYSIPTDCPHREKNGWTGDAHLGCEFGLLNFDAAAAYTKWINDLADEQQSDGRLPGIVPTAGWGYDWGNGPAWDSAYLLIPDYLRQYCGDQRLLDRQFAGHRRYVDYLRDASDNLIIKFGLGDWAPWKTETPADLTSTAYFYRDTQIVAATAARRGDASLAEQYTQLAANIRDSFQRQYWDAEQQTYRPATQTSLSCALYQGLVSPEQQSRVVELLLEQLEKTDHHIDTGILGSKYLLTCLSDRGQADAAYRVASQETQPSWGWWIKQGATTLWEQWTTADSHNHIMYGDVAAWFTKALVGLEPDANAEGFANVIIRPNPVGDLQWARASHDSLRGTIQVEWRRTDSTFDLDVTLPANVTGTVYLPTADATSIELQGESLAESPYVAVVGTEAGRTQLQIQSGSYTFTCPLAAGDK